MSHNQYGKPIPLPSRERLFELFDYNPWTGEFINLTTKDRRGRLLAGTLTTDGRIRIAVDKKTYFRSRLIWMYVYGVDPGDIDVDHENKNRRDDRLNNLRLLTAAENNRNKLVTELNGGLFYWENPDYYERERQRNKRRYRNLTPEQREERRERNRIAARKYRASKR